MKKFKENKNGFTVLEFLVVVAMMGILIALVLVGLTRARSQSRDQGKVSEIQKIAIGLEQYYDICGKYPEDLTGTETCPALDIQNKTIADILPEVASMSFNQTNSPYFYAGIPFQCTGFHIGVQLEGDASLFLKSNKTSEIISKCNNTIATPGFDAVSNNIFDIWREK